MKKFLSLVLVFAMLASLVVINVSAATVDEWDGTVDIETFLNSGDGTKENPYRITTAEAFAGFAALTNPTDSAEFGGKFAGKYIVQDVDIDLANITWTPISWKAENSFVGVYDGQGHTISGLNIDQNLAGGPCLALFGYVGTGASDVALDADCGIANLTVRGSVSVPNRRVAGVVGQINRNAYVNNTHRVYITNVVSEVAINVTEYTTDAIWGGVAGYVASAVFENVTNKGDITLDGNVHNYIPLGGIAGRAENVDMIGCVNSGDIKFSTSRTDNSLRVGGIVGQIYKANVNQVQNFINCVNTGDITATMTTEQGNKVFAGGIVGGVWYNISGKGQGVGNITNTEDSMYGKNYAIVEKWADTEVYWSNFKTTFAGCVNTGAVSANKTVSDGNTNAGGILGSAYAGNNRFDNNGGFTFESCVNAGTVTATNTGRCAGITQGFWTNNDYHYNNYMNNCVTKASLDSNSKKHYATFSSFATEVLNQQVTNCTQNDNKATAMVTTYSTIVPSTFDINGFPTGVDTSVWTGGASGMLLGSGTATDPYLVRNANDLKGLALMVNGSVQASGYNGYNINNVNTFDGKYIKQTVDIDLGNLEWLPIGFRETAVFQGVYDGDNHSVTNLKITTISYRTGLFGGVGYVKSSTASHTNVAPTGECGIANLEVSGNVELTSTTGHGNRFYTGGVVSFLNDDQLTGEHKAFLINVTSTVNVKTTGFSGGTAVGGVVGHAYNAVLENVVNGGTVSVDATNKAKQPAGGIVGFAKSCDLKNCVNNGAVSVTTANNDDKALAGGIVGRYDKHNVANYLNFTNCVNNGLVTATSTHTSPGYVGAGGMLGGFWYNVAGTGVGNITDETADKYGKNYAIVEKWNGTDVYWSDMKVTFVNCVNTNEVSAYATGEGVTSGTGAVQAGGILSSTYAGYHKTENNGGFLFDNCVNTGVINCTNPGRSAGIVGTVWTDGQYAYGIKFIHCLTTKSAGEKGQLIKPGTFGIGEKETVYLTATGELSTTDDPYANSPGSSRAESLATWIEEELIAPSTTNINEMPTAAKVAVLTGVKNDVVELPYEVPATMVVVNAEGTVMNVIEEPGKYTVKVAFIDVTPYVEDYFSLSYRIAYEEDYLTDAATMEFGFGALTNSVSVVDNSGDFHKFSTYGKATAAIVTGEFNGITPQQIPENVKVAIVDGGEELISYDEYSLQTYALNQLGKTAEQLGISETKKAALDAFLVDMLKYSEVAQIFTGIDTNHATKPLSPEQLALGTVFTTNGLSDVKNVTDDYGDEIITWTAATLVFDSSITMRLKFTTEDYDAIYGYTFQVYVNGDFYEAFAVSDVVVAEEDYFYIDFAGFAPDTYADEYSVYLVDGDATTISETVTYSVNSYIINKYEDAKYGALVQALACYSASANAYLAAQ